MQKSQVEGMKAKPAGGADRKPFAQNLMPTNVAKAVGGVKKMLGAIKHVGRPEAGGKMPFAK